MKRSINSFLILLMLTMSTVIFPKHASAQETDVNFQVFYDELSPYGEWVDYENYGYVWIPDAGSDFVPYSTDGYWLLSDYGWTWVSDYEWGWAPFHYGRWDYNNYYGWFWVPDNEWGPAWVNWRQADGYYGWSPMEPGISLSISFGRQYNRDNDHWMFVRDRDFERRDINRYYVNRTDHDRIIRNSTVIRSTHIDNSRHTTYVTGPDRADVQRVTGRQIKPVSIRENSRPGQQMNNGQLQMYRPQVSKNNNRERKAAPSRITNLKDVRRPSERDGLNRQRNASPANNNDRQQQQNAVSQPSQQRTSSPANNNGRQQQQRQQEQQRNATPANNNRQQRQQEQQRQQQQRTANPANNNGRQQQQQRQQQQRQQEQQQQRQQEQQKQVQQQQQQQQQRQQQQQQQRQQEQQKQVQQQQQRQQQQEQQKQQRQQRTANPANDNGRQQQQRRQRQPEQSQPQQQRQEPQQQQNTAKPENNKNEQPKESRSERRKKRNE